jgi:hypothetical protein
MTKFAILGLMVILASGCYYDPNPFLPSYPYGYAYNQYQPYRPYRPYQPNSSMPHYEELEPKAYGPQGYPHPDPDGVVRSPDDEEVIGGDEPPPDGSNRQVRPQPPVERHRDHTGDYNP